MEKLKNEKTLPIELQGEIYRDFAQLKEKADFNTKSTLKFELNEAKKEEFQKRVNELVVKETQIRVEIEGEKSRHKSAMEDINSRLTNTKNEMVAKVDCIENKYYNEEREIAEYSLEKFNVKFAEINGKPQIVDFNVPYSPQMNFTSYDEIFVTEDKAEDENQGTEK
jgi:uncharacterized protein YPO0396